MKRGIVDPWKINEPLQVPKPKVAPAAGKKNLAEIDFDADIQPARSCVFRSAHASIEVANNKVTNENDALRDLVRCLFSVLELVDGPGLFDEHNIGFRLSDRQFDPPTTLAGSAYLMTKADYTPHAAIYFRNQSFDQGVLRLVRILRAVQKRPGIEGETLLKRMGITPMLR